MAKNDDAAVPADLPEPPTEKCLKLRTPLRFNDKDENPIFELNLTEPTAGQMSKFLKASMKAGADDVEASCVFISENSGVKIESIRLLKARDFQDALDFLNSFMKAGPAAGPN